MLLKSEKCHGYSFYCFWVIKGEPEPTGGKITPTHTQLNKIEANRKNSNKNRNYNQICI